jgi:hypothetical protein
MNDNIIAQKRCPQCGEIKDLSEFPHNKRTKSGFASWCKKCCNAKTNGAYHNNPKRNQYIRDFVRDRYQRLKIESPEFIQSRRQESKDWNESHPEQHMRSLTRCQDSYRAERMGSEGSYTIQERVDLENEYGGRCAYCGSTDKVGLDHVIPLCLGGTNSIDNLVPCCHACNVSKGKKPLLVWMAQKRGNYENIDNYSLKIK